MVEVGVMIAVIVALVEMIKRIDLLPVKYLPLFSLVLGMLGGLIYWDGSLKEQIFYGMMTGLAASGLFDQSKIFSKKDEK